MKSWDIHAEFCEMLFKEFFNQGDIEREKGLPISPLCDRNTQNKPESQISKSYHVTYMPKCNLTNDHNMASN